MACGHKSASHLADLWCVMVLKCIVTDRFSPASIAITIMLFLFSSPVHSEPAGNVTNGRMLTCLVFSMETISLLNELQQVAKDETKSKEVKASIDMVGGREKIALALLDAELVLEAFAKKISDRHIIKMDEKLFENPMWQLANKLYSDTIKDTSFNQKFSRTVDFTQSCMDRFLR